MNLQRLGVASEIFGLLILVDSGKFFIHISQKAGINLTVKASNFPERYQKSGKSTDDRLIL